MIFPTIYSVHVRSLQTTTSRLCAAKDFISLNPIVGFRPSMTCAVSCSTVGLERTNLWTMKTIESATSERDHLTALPAELLHTIFSFLLPTHYPERAAYDGCQEQRYCHPLDYVAATSKHLRSEVNEWALHFLLSYKAITNFERPRSATKKSGGVNHLRGRKGLLTWISSHCIFCGKTSRRQAILVNGFRCCAACDRAQW
jgi:hypothetical protein